jgi:hypothetical protein
MATETRLDPALSRQVSKAQRAAQRALRTEPRAASAEYDRATGKVRVRMHNGTSFVVPMRMLDELDGASDEDLARVEVPPPASGSTGPLSTHTSH